MSEFITRMRDDLISKGYRVIPTKDGRPLCGFKEGQQFPAGDPLWEQANMIAINQHDTVAVDLDGYKEGAADAATIAAYLGITPQQLEAARVQSAHERKSHHWMFRLPVGVSVNFSGNVGLWLPHVDLRFGSNNQLLFSKEGKEQRFPPVTELPMLDLSRVLVPFPQRVEPVLTGLPVTLSDSTSVKGAELLREQCDKLRKVTEGGRNAALNDTALIVAHYVCGGGGR